MGVLPLFPMIGSGGIAMFARNQFKNFLYQAEDRRPSSSKVLKKLSSMEEVEILSLRERCGLDLLRTTLGKCLTLNSFSGS